MRESRPSFLLADDPTKRVFKKLSQSAYMLVGRNREHKVVSASETADRPSKTSQVAQNRLLLYFRFRNS